MTIAKDTLTAEYMSLEAYLDYDDGTEGCGYELEEGLLVVSSSDTDKRSRERDYVTKRQNYAERGIAEYWIVDPIAAVIWVLTLTDQAYEEQSFVSDEYIVSSEFPHLQLTAQQVLNAGL
jgi:Uma2 family endonuclease